VVILSLSPKIFFGCFVELSTKLTYQKNLSFPRVSGGNPGEWLKGGFPTGDFGNDREKGRNIK